VTFFDVNLRTMTAVFTLLCSPAMATEISGPATVQDGDTIYVSGVSVRLHGVDAPELREPGGIEARDQLAGIVAGNTIRCIERGRPSRGRMVAVCTTSAGLNLNAEIIRRGFALDCPRYSNGRYRSLEPTGARQRLVQKPYC